MDTTRLSKISRLIQKELGDYFQKNGNTHFDGALVSVTTVRVSPDLRNAIVFALPLGGINTDAVVEALNRNQGELRHLVTKGLKLKHAPELKFLADRSFDQMKGFDKLIPNPNKN